MTELTITWSARYIDPDSGRECSIGVEGNNSSAVMEKAKKMIAWLDQIGAASPTAAQPSAPLIAPQPLETGQRRLLITKIKKTSPTRADLYGRGHRYRDTTLFDLAELLAVGLDPGELQEGIETPCLFGAIVTESEKLNKNGNPYLDVVRLERTQ